MVSRGIKWSTFYFIMFAIAILNGILGVFIFWNSEKDSLEAEGRQHTTDKLSKTEVLKRSIRNRPTILAALFIFAYQGVEVANSSWTVSFLIVERHGKPANVGNVTAGFWGGKRDLHDSRNFS